MKKASRTDELKNAATGPLKLLRRRFSCIGTLVEIEAIEHVAKHLCFSNSDSDTLAHLLVVGRPSTDVVNGLSLVPADEVELFVPAVVTLAYDADFVNYFILDFRHFEFLLVYNIVFI